MMIHASKIIYTCIILILSNSICTSQKLISKQFLKSYPKSYFINQGVFLASADVDCYKITYTTINPEGNLDTASGFVSMPKLKTLGYTLLAYHHGTVGSRTDVPSNLSFEHILPAVFSSIGYISIAPDYIGLGTSRGQHTYVHAASEASASKDMLPAAVEFLYSEGYNTTKDLFITGYSQGGHAGMALHRLLETEGTEYNLKAASHMSGPYDISTSMKNLLLGDEEYALVAYTANVALSLNRVYHIFPTDKASDLFIEPYASMVENFRNEVIDLWTLNELMLDELTKNGGKAQPKRMIIPSVLNDIITNENHPLNLALKDNNVYDWKPVTPTRLLYCKGDDQVSFINTIVADSTMKSNGSTSVSSFDVNTNATHTECVNPAVTNTIFFFIGFYNTTSISDLIEYVNIYPNPASSSINTEFEISQAIAINMEGQQYHLTIDNTSADISSLPRGTYVMLLKNKNDKWLKSKVVKI